MFGRKKSPSLAEMKANMMPSPDRDGVTRVFSKELWDDPKTGAFLRQVGMNPDDERNRVRTADDHIAHFARAREALMQRAAAYNRDMTAKHGHCNARPMLVIGPDIWDSEHGAFLYGQLDLCGFDEWNILMCAGDQETIDRCGLIGHPGVVSALDQKMIEKIVELKTLHGRAHDAFGLHILEQGGIDREEYDRTLETIKRDLLSYVEFCRAKITEIFSRPTG